MALITIAVTNQKGGVAKTTTAVTLAATLAKKGFKTLLVDVDPQNNATSGVGFRGKELKTTVYDVLQDDDKAAGAVAETPFENLYVLPAELDLAGAEFELVAEINREGRLKAALAQLDDAFEFCIIDCPPSLGILTVNGLVASDYCMVPIEPDVYALDGMGRFISTYATVKRHLNNDLKFLGVAACKVDARRSITDEVLNAVSQYFEKEFGENLLFDTRIGQDTQTLHAAAAGEPLPFYNDKTRASQQYEELTQEVLKRVGKEI